MFILELTHKAWAHAQERYRTTIEKHDIVAALNETDYCDFLVDIRTTKEVMEPAPPTAIPGGPYDPMYYYDLLYYRNN
ncbi:hypothetical protein IEQ34_009548 [Dendrobium chrysotoxum]|uniref:Uncharacterized protein n=1 Tax=Dendrobium chrysotoxum TaxID=161865 RepID=A0AAV7H282_DENCH|nr:hypothetical protein IEQ34_009548 [Dendrobium chrysotoxum]